MNELVARKGKKERERLSFSGIYSRCSCLALYAMFNVLCFVIIFVLRWVFTARRPKAKGGNRQEADVWGGGVVMLQKERKVIVYPFTQRFSILSPRTQPPK